MTKEGMIFKMQNLNFKIKTNNSKAITLIALVITVIVLLILAGVAIATLTGDNGLLQKASNAKKTNEEASALEKIKVEVAGSYGLDGKIDKEQLNKNLKRINGLKYDNETLNEETSIELPAIVELDQNSYQITSDGSVSIVKPQLIGNLTKDNYGDYIDLGQNVVRTSSTSDDWRILYNDTNNAYGGTNGARVYAILADYLPNSNPAVAASGLNKVDGTTYNVNSTISRQDLLNKFNNTDAWKSLIPEKLRNSCKVKGAATGEMIMASYNKKYSINPPLNYTDLPYFYIDNDSSKDIDTLYMPRIDSTPFNNCMGYWLASPRTWDDAIYRVRYSGEIAVLVYSNTDHGICPIVSLPSNIQVTPTTSNGKTIWSLVQ